MKLKDGKTSVEVIRRQDNRQGSLSLFLGALPLFLLWLMLPVALLVLSSLYQSNRLLRERVDRAHTESTYSLTAPTGEELVFHISIPHRLRIDPDAAYDDTLVVWLTSEVGGEPNASAPGYLFSFTAVDDSVDLTDENGTPSPGIVTLSPAQANGDAKILCLKTNPARITGKNATLRVISLSLQGAADPINIPVEQLSTSRLRHFLDAAFGFPTLIGGLLTAIAGFGLQQWKVLSDEAARKKEDAQRKRQRDEDELYKKIESAFDDSNYVLAFDSYLRSLESSTDLGRFERMFEDRVNRAIEKELVNSPYTHVMTLYQLIVRANLSNLKLLWEDVVTRRFGNLITTPNPESATRLYKLLEKNALVNSKIQEAWVSRGSYFAGQDVAIFQLRHLLKSCPQIIIYEASLRRQENIEIKRSMALLGIKINPFGAEKAEEDLLFTETENIFIQSSPEKVDPDAISRRDFLHSAVISAFPIPLDDQLERSQIIVGAAGSGKTALAMALARKAFTLENKALPLYCQIYPSDDVGKLLGRATKSLLIYYINNPDEFFDLDHVRRMSFSVLVSKYFADGTELPSRLKLAGVSEEPLCNKLYEFLIKLDSSANLGKLPLEEAAQMALQACPFQYKQIWFLFDCQHLPDDEVVDSKNIIELVHYLHLYGGVIKIFSHPSQFLEDVQAELGWDLLKLDWNTENLKNLLRVRIANSDLEGVGRLFDNSVRRFSQELFVRTENTGPSHLIRMGNATLIQYAKQGGPLNVDNAKGIFGSSLVRKVIRESTVA